MKMYSVIDYRDNTGCRPITSMFYPMRTTRLLEYTLIIGYMAQFKTVRQKKLLLGVKDLKSAQHWLCEGDSVLISFMTKNAGIEC